MTIRALRTKALSHRLKTPYVWAQATNDEITTVLVEIEDESGQVGVGEAMSAPDANDAASADRPAEVGGFAEGLTADALTGKRIAVVGGGPAPQHG